MRVTTKPEHYEAIQFSRNNWEQIQGFTNGKARDLTIPRTPSGIASCTLELFGENNQIRTTQVFEGDWIVEYSHESFARFSNSQMSYKFFASEEQNLT